MYFILLRRVLALFLEYRLCVLLLPLHLSITYDQRAAANQVWRGRSVAKEEVWLSLRVAAIQRRWLKRLDCERLSIHFLWNLNHFGKARLVIHS